MHTRHASTIRTTVILLLCGLMAALLSAPTHAFALEEAPLQQAVSSLTAYFTPMTATISSVSNATLTTDLPADTPLLPGMRFSVLRAGTAFVHPVTGEVIGSSEEQVGRAEVVNSPQGELSIVMLDGKEAREGDVLRISSGRIRTLFYQNEAADWDLAEEFFFLLKDTERFDLVETRPGTADTETITAMARNAGADIAIILTAPGETPVITLRQKLLWSDSDREFFTQDTAVATELLSTYKTGSKYFSPLTDSPLAEYRFPLHVLNITINDVNGDGSAELIAHSGSALYFYETGPTLKPAFNRRTPRSLTFSYWEKLVWLQSADLDGDGRAEILFSTLRETSPRSYIYSMIDDEFKQTWTSETFARIIGSSVYIQSGRSEGGFSGPVTLAANVPGDSASTAPATIALPEDANLYSFIPAPGKPGLMVSLDEVGHIKVTDNSGMVHYKSEHPYNQGLKSYGRDAIPKHDKDIWWIADRMIIKGPAVITLQHVRKSVTIGPIGLLSSRISALFPSRDNTSELILIDKLRPSTFDFAIYGDMLYVVEPAYGLNMLNLFKGQTVTTTKVKLYSIKGK